MKVLEMGGGSLRRPFLLKHRPSRQRARCPTPIALLKAKPLAGKTTVSIPPNEIPRFRKIQNGTIVRLKRNDAKPLGPHLLAAMHPLGKNSPIDALLQHAVFNSSTFGNYLSLPRDIRPIWMHTTRCFTHQNALLPASLEN